MTINELLSHGKDCLKNNCIENELFESKQILKRVFQFSDLDLILNGSNQAESDKIDLFNKYINERIENYPLQYIIGNWDFYTSTFQVGDGVLIPRPETEILVENAISIIKENNLNTVFDLCSGSGCIGLSIAKECNCDVYMFEKYDEAFSYLSKNNDIFGLINTHLIKGDILEISTFKTSPIPEIIISNPPYVTSDDCFGLQKEVKYEPLSALDGGYDGLIFYKSIFKIFGNSEVKYFCFECGENQSEKIHDIFGNDFEFKVVTDHSGFDRIVILERKK